MQFAFYAAAVSVRPRLRWLWSYAGMLHINGARSERDPDSISNNSSNLQGTFGIDFIITYSLGRNQSSLLTESIHRFCYILSVEESSVKKTRILWQVQANEIRFRNQRTCKAALDSLELRN